MIVRIINAESRIRVSAQSTTNVVSLGDNPGPYAVHHLHIGAPAKQRVDRCRELVQRDNVSGQRTSTVAVPALPGDVSALRVTTR